MGGSKVDRRSFVKSAACAVGIVGCGGLAFGAPVIGKSQVLMGVEEFDDWQSRLSQRWQDVFYDNWSVAQPKLLAHIDVKAWHGKVKKTGNCQSQARKPVNALAQLYAPGKQESYPDVRSTERGIENMAKWFGETKLQAINKAFRDNSGPVVYFETLTGLGLWYGIDSVRRGDGLADVSRGKWQAQVSGWFNTMSDAIPYLAFELAHRDKSMYWVNPLEFAHRQEAQPYIARARAELCRGMLA